MIKIIKIIVLPILHSIRKVLTILKKHCSPNYIPEPPRSYISSYEMYTKEEEIKCYNHFKKFFKNAIFLDTERIRKYSIQKSIENDNEQKSYYLEFGVFNGISINFFSKYLKTNIYGFDSFKGLNEDWRGSILERGYFNLKGKEPKVNKNVTLIKGWVQDTLLDFLKKKPKINFVHMDLDTYESTKFVLKNIKPLLCKNSIILFDELYNFSGWDVGEYKALTEVFNETEYKFLAFSKQGSQAVIKIN